MKKVLIMMMCVIMVVCFMPTVAMAGEGDNPTVDVGTFDDLKTALKNAGAAHSGNTTINITADIEVPDGATWDPIYVDGYNGAGVVTVNGNNHTISGLKAPLFLGGYAGKSGIVINGLTIDDFNFEGLSWKDSLGKDYVGLGAFISNVDSMAIISLTDCHLINSNINSTGDTRVGGLIGWTAGYNNPNDGPVDTYINVTNCSVENTNITAAGAVGAIIGHAGNNPATYHTIQGCTVTGCTLYSTDNGGWRVGVVVGTANVGQVTIEGITESGNTLTQTGKTAPEHSNLYGRFVPGNTGFMVIDGTIITDVSALDPVAMVDGVYYGTLADAINKAGDNGTIKLLKDATFDWGGNSYGNSGALVLRNKVIKGATGTETITFKGYGSANPIKDLTLSNIIVKDETVGDNESAWEHGYLEFDNLQADGVTFVDSIQTNGSCTLNNCTFNNTVNGWYHAWVNSGSSTFTNCVFKGTRAVKIHEAYGSEVSSVTVDECVFGPLSEKPGVVIGDLNNDTTVTSLDKGTQPFVVCDG